MEFQLNGRDYSADDVLTMDPSGFPTFDQQIFTIIKEWLEGRNTFIFQTSGSTGKPKEVEFSRKQIISSAKRTVGAFELKKGDVVLCCLNPQFVAGFMMIIRAIEGELHLIIQKPSGNPLSAIGHQHIDFVAMTPNQVKQSIRASKGKFDQVGRLLIGGAGISPGLESSLRNLDISAFHSYAMTETLTHVALRDISKGERTYYALDGVSFGQQKNDCLIVNDDLLDIYQLRTNDVVDLKDSQSFEWKGRIDNMINTGGVKVQVEEMEIMIEELLQQAGMKIPFCLLSKPDEMLTNKLVLVLEDEKNIVDPDRVLSVLKSGLPRYHDPKQVVVVPNLLKTPTGKIDRMANSNAYL